MVYDCTGYIPQHMQVAVVARVHLHGADGSRWQLTGN